MSIRVITAMLHGDAQDRHILDACLLVAGTSGAHIDAVHLMPGPGELDAFRNPYFPDFHRGMEGEYRQVTQDLAATSYGQFEAWAQANGVGTTDSPCTAQWHEERHSADDSAWRILRFSDLAVIRRPSGRLLRLELFILEALLLASGHPALLVPPSFCVRGFDAAVIAWNGSVEAIHAINGALPLLRRMRHVTILVVGEQLMPHSEPDRLANYLARHDVLANVVVIPVSQSVVPTLLDSVQDRRADLLVMGAYTHSPTHQQFFGGTTIDLLQHAPIPILMAH